MKRETQISIFFYFLVAIAVIVKFIDNIFYATEPSPSVILLLGFTSPLLIAFALEKSRIIRNPDLSLIFSVVGGLVGIFVYILHFSYYFGMYMVANSILYLLLLGFMILLFWYKKLWKTPA